jgi:putative DNA methylase
MAILCVWEKGAEEIKHVFMRWALPITWDYAEANPIAPIERFYAGGINSAQMVLSKFFETSWENTFNPIVLNHSALQTVDEEVDIIFTDPPYYDAIPYSDLMDFFYIWLKRSINGLSPEIDSVLNQYLAPKWDSLKQDGELIDDESRHGGNSEASKKAYEEGMYKAFVAGCKKLKPEGRLVVVFANKNPFAWETLVSSIIRAGFCVTGSWPIASEMPGGLRNLNRASLASSIWLVCKKRPETARPGWDNRVLDEMRQKITTRLRDFWDAGIRGPDFVWAATGPALESYSQYPAVKKANEPGQLMTVGEFLRHVRRMVVDFVVGRVLSGEGGTESVSGLDDITTYYLLHRHDFGFEEAPAGACILYAISCGLSDRELADRYDLLTSSGKPRSKSEDDETEEDGDQEPEYEESSGSTLRLKGWKERKSPSLGMDPALDKLPAHLPLFPDMESQATPSRSLPLIDQVHRLMHLWKAGDVNKVNDYLDIRGLRRNQLFQQLLQALIELAPAGSEERALLESISNHVGARGIESLRFF